MNRIEYYKKYSIRYVWGCRRRKWNRGGNKNEIEVGSFVKRIQKFIRCERKRTWKRVRDCRRNDYRKEKEVNQVEPIPTI